MATPTSQQLAIAKLYIALFNRAPDADGFAFWTQALANGASLDALAQSMLTAPEAGAIYPAGQSSKQFVTSYYTSVFGRAPDAEGLAFWSAALEGQGGAGNPAARAALTMQISTIASTPLASKPEGMSDAAYNQTVADRGRFINKTEFGVYFAAELKSNDLALAKSTLALVTDRAASMTVAVNLANGTATPDTSTPGTPAPAPGLTITVADSALEIGSKFAAYGLSSATVDATGMVTAQLNAVAAAVGKIAANGITGTLALDSSQNATQLTALLGAQTASAANVSVNAAGMVSAQVVALGLGAAKVDSLSNLPAISFGNFAITDQVTAGLFAMSAPGTMRLTGASSASEVQLALIAANLSKILSMTGNLALTSDTSATTMASLLNAKLAAGISNLITVSAGNMSAEQLAVVTGAIAGVAGLSLNSGVSATDLGTLLALPGIASVNVTASAAGMTTAQVDALANGASAITSLAMDKGLSVQTISALLSAPGIGPAAVTVDATDMSAGQLDAVGRGVSNVDTLLGVGKLLLGDPLMSDAGTTGLVSRATAGSLTATATGASTAEVSLLVANLSKVAAGGIDGTLVLSSTDLPLVTHATLAPKLALGTTVAINGTTAKDAIDLSAWSMIMRIDGGAGADRIVLGNSSQTVFIGSRAESRSTPSLTDTTTTNIETIANFTSVDVLRFSTAAGVFGTDIAIRAGAIALNPTVTNGVDILTLGDLITIANAFNNIIPLVASTSAAPQIYVIHSYAYNGGVTPGGLANKTFFILNDDNPAITLDDTIIAIENYVGTIGSVTMIEAGV